MRATTALPALFLLASIGGAAAETTIPDALIAPGEKTVVTLHAEGAQVYDCKAAADGKLAWAFREPIATLMDDGKTGGRHYAGPNWEHQDGSIATGRVVGTANNTTDNNIAWHKHKETNQKNNNKHTNNTTKQQNNTQGGKLEGACDTAGNHRSVAYSADYVFLRKE